MTPDEQLERLDAELDRLKSEHPNVPGILRLTNNCLRACSKWRWEQHGWTLSDGEACAIMNGDDKQQRTALSSDPQRAHDSQGPVCSRRRCAGGRVGLLTVAAPQIIPLQVPGVSPPRKTTTR